MRRGAKQNPPTELRRRGTYRADRHSGLVELVEADALPQRPESLTDAGEQVWLDNIGRVASTRILTERDSALFGQWCNLMGALNLAWASGEVPPISALTEARRMAELFGLGGAKSRLHAPPDRTEANPFARHGRRQPESSDG